MFWKIIIEKIFGINLQKSEVFENIQDSRTANVKSVAKLWEKELVQQALFVKNVTPLLSKGASMNKTDFPCKSPCIRTETMTRIPQPCNKTDNKEPPRSLKINKVKSPTSSLLSQRTKTTDLGRSSCSVSRNSEKSTRKLHRCTSVRVRTVDKACEPCIIENEELKTYKNNIELLQQRCNCQECEIDKLKEENNSLKIELQNFYKKCSWKTSVLHTPVPKSSDFDKAALVPKPFECSIDDSTRENSVKNTDSEMIITMKNCRNEVGKSCFKDFFRSIILAIG